MSTPFNTPPIIAATHHFFELLFSGAEAGWLVLTHPDPHQRTKSGKPALLSDWFNLEHISFATIATAAQRYAPQYDVYFGVVLQHPACVPSAWHRSKNSTAYLVPGLYADLDLAYGKHAASTLPATDAELLDFLSALPAPPSLIVHSGGGMYPYWLFREPDVITTAAEHETIAHLLRQLSHTLVMAGKMCGWTLDGVGDLARVLRPPGTINHKYGKRVEILHESDLRYNPSEFAWLLDLPAPVRTTHAAAAIAGQPDLVAIAEHYGTALDRKSQTELAGPHPQHGSSTGDNFNVNVAKGLWHCWRHGTGGDALALIAVCEGLLACEQMVSGALRGALFQRVVEIAKATFHASIVLGSSQQEGAVTKPYRQRVYARLRRW
jgi:hypothetical protein